MTLVRSFSFAPEGIGFSSCVCELMVYALSIRVDLETLKYAKASGHSLTLLQALIMYGCKTTIPLADSCNGEELVSLSHDGDKSS